MFPLPCCRRMHSFLMCFVSTEWRNKKKENEITAPNFRYVCVCVCSLEHALAFAVKPFLQRSASRHRYKYLNACFACDTFNGEEKKEKLKNWSRKDAHRRNEMKRQIVSRTEFWLRHRCDRVGGRWIASDVGMQLEVRMWLHLNDVTSDEYLLVDDDGNETTFYQCVMLESGTVVVVVAVAVHKHYCRNECGAVFYLLKTRIISTLPFCMYKLK